MQRKQTAKPIEVIENVENTQELNLLEEQTSSIIEEVVSEEVVKEEQTQENLNIEDLNYFEKDNLQAILNKLKTKQVLKSEEIETLKTRKNYLSETEKVILESL